MKVILAVFSFQNLGGKERDCLAVGRFLKERGHDVTIVTTSVASQVLAVNVRLIPPSGFSNHARMRNFAKAVQSFVETAGADVVLGFDPMPSIDFYYAAGGGFAVRTKGWRSWMPRQSTYLSLEKSVFGKSSPTQVFFLTERQRKSYADIYDFDASRATVLPVVIHDEHYAAVDNSAARSQTRRELGLSEDAMVAISVAVKPLQKGVDRTLKALANHPALHLIIVGSSDDWVERQARDLNVANRVKILSYQSDAMSLMRAADFLAHPARFEAGGQVILEALLAGIPAIVSDVCGYANEITRSRAGIVVSGEFDQGKFSKAISALTNELPVMRKAAREESARQMAHRGRWTSVIAEKLETFRK